MVGEASPPPPPYDSLSSSAVGTLPVCLTGWSLPSPFLEFYPVFFSSFPPSLSHGFFATGGGGGTVSGSVDRLVVFFTFLFG